MCPTNDFVPFCNENTGTNLPTQSAYLANPQLPIGNQPGIASSSLNNKAVRQASTMAAVMAQIATEYTGADMLDNQNTADHAIPPALKAAMIAATKRHLPVITKYTAGSGNHNMTYKFQISSGNATAAATYSDGTTTFTVSATIVAGTQLDATGPAAPIASGTLTKLTGSGDATIIFYAARAPLYLKVIAVGGGGGGAGISTAAASSGGGPGGGGGGTCIGNILSPTGQYAYSIGAAGTGGAAAGGTGGNGGNTTFGGLYTAGGGKGGHGNSAQNAAFFFTGSSPDSDGGTASGADINVNGTPGAFGQFVSVAATNQGNGGNSLYGVGGHGYGSTTGTGPAGNGFGGGGAGGLVINNSGNAAGGAGTAGAVIIEEHYQ